MSALAASSCIIANISNISSSVKLPYGSQPIRTITRSNVM